MQPKILIQQYGIFSVLKKIGNEWIIFLSYNILYSHSINIKYFWLLLATILLLTFWTYSDCTWEQMWGGEKVIRREMRIKLAWEIMVTKVSSVISQNLPRVLHLSWSSLENRLRICMVTCQIVFHISDFKQQKSMIANSWGGWGWDM